MKPLFSEQLYMERWDEYLEPIPGGDYLNLERDFDRAMETYAEIREQYPNGKWEIVETHEAKKIAERAEAWCRKKMKTIKDIESGKASLGYITVSQEVEARYELRTRFDFNCLQLKVFKKKHNL